MKNIPNIYYISPYSLTLEYGKELNKHIKIMPKNAWIVITDYDTMFLTPNYGRLINNAILAYPDTDLFTCETNRLGQHKRCYDLQRSENDSIKYHIRLAIQLERERGHECVDVNDVIAGMFWCFPKRVWLDNKFDDLKIIDRVDDENIKSFDVRWSEKIKGIKRKILGLYIWHTYRIDNNIGDTDHLEIL